MDLDARVLLALHGDGHGVLGATMIAATVLGEGWTAMLLLPLLAYPRTRRLAAALTVAVAVQIVSVWTLKAVVGRVRPWIALGLAPTFGAPHDPSFPSGHAAGSFCVAAFLVLALPAAWPRWRGRAWAVAALSVGLAALIATSRVYLAVHYPTDVLAGAVLGSTIGAIAGRRFAAAARGRALQERPGVGGGPPVGVERAAKRG